MYLDILRYILILRDCRLRIYLLTMPACMCNKFFTGRFFSFPVSDSDVVLPLAAPLCGLFYMSEQSSYFLLLSRALLYPQLYCA